MKKKEFMKVIKEFRMQSAVMVDKEGFLCIGNEQRKTNVPLKIIDRVEVHLDVEAMIPNVQLEMVLSSRVMVICRYNCILEDWKLRLERDGEILFYFIDVFFDRNYVWDAKRKMIYNKLDGDLLICFQDSTMIKFPSKIKKVTGHEAIPQTAFAIDFNKARMIGGNSIFEVPAMVKTVVFSGGRIRRIGARTFDHCIFLEHVLLPPSVLEVDKKAFSKSGISPGGLVNLSDVNMGEEYFEFGRDRDYFDERFWNIEETRNPTPDFGEDSPMGEISWDTFDDQNDQEDE